MGILMEFILFLHTEPSENENPMRDYLHTLKIQSFLRDMIL